MSVSSPRQKTSEATFCSRGTETTRNVDRVVAGNNEILHYGSQWLVSVLNDKMSGLNRRARRTDVEYGFVLPAGLGWENMRASGWRSEGALGTSNVI
ncbi:MAG: hypothetical protein U5K72_14425 [Balneolaceae bacterium]|nr:hypothetical protein [Balneolaceae bacterium]